MRTAGHEDNIGEGLGEIKHDEKVDGPAAKKPSIIFKGFFLR
jgi:hypothetical protein